LPAQIILIDNLIICVGFFVLGLVFEVAFLCVSCRSDGVLISNPTQFHPFQFFGNVLALWCYTFSGFEEDLFETRFAAFCSYFGFCAAS
jgi:hypothetical protein